MYRLSYFILLLALFALPPFVQADTAAFDLSGPRLEISVTRAGKTLPISQVPNLQPQDRLWVHLVVPPGQTVHYLMVMAFLRGSTNPPPENWFVKVETWNKRVRSRGNHGNGPQGRAAGAAAAGSADGRRFRHPAFDGSRQAGSFRKSVAGPEPRQPGSLAAGQIPGRDTASLGHRSQEPARHLRPSGPQLEHQARQTMF